MRIGQARLIEAVAAIVILALLFAMIPSMFKSPLTPLRSQVQVDVSQYAYNMLYTLVSNPSFIRAIQSGNWSEIHSLASLVIGPQFNWFIGLEPLYDAYAIGSYVLTANYAKINMTVAPSPMVNGGYALVTIPVLTLNQGLPLGFRVNTTMPMANVFITTVTGKPVYWWLEDYNYITGEATVWLYVPSGSSELVMYVSSNSNVPYDPLTGSYCSIAYCPPYGGVSSLMSYTMKLPPTQFNNGPSVFNPQGYTAYMGFTTNNVYCSGNGYISISGYSLTLKAPQGASETCSVINPWPYGTLITMIGQLIKTIPNSQLSISANYYITLYNGALNQGFTVPVNVVLQYGLNSMSILLYINGYLVNALSNVSYSYLYRLTIDASSSASTCLTNNTSAAVNVNVAVNMYNYVSGVEENVTGSYQLCSSLPYTPSASTSIEVNGLTLSLTSPPYAYPNYYYYNTTEVIYDLLLSQPAYSTLILNTYVNYAVIHNVIPSQYAYGVGGVGFTPTTGAYTIIELPNGTYYLLTLEIQSLGGG